MSMLVWVSWSHSCCFYSFIEELKKPFLSVNQSVGKYWFTTKTYVEMMQVWQMANGKR